MLESFFFQKNIEVRERLETWMRRKTKCQRVDKSFRKKKIKKKKNKTKILET